MAYQEYNWSVSGQADGPDAWITEEVLEHGGVVDADIWDDRTNTGLHTPSLELTKSGSDFTHGGLFGDTPTLGQPWTGESH